MIDARRMLYGDAAPPLILPPLPASLTYLQLVCNTKVIVSSRATGTVPVEFELHAALPASLRCLSLTLPRTRSTSRLLAALPRKCPLLTYCHCQVEGWEMQSLRERLGEAVWCAWPEAVEWHRLDHRWRRELRAVVIKLSAILLTTEDGLLAWETNAAMLQIHIIPFRQANGANLKNDRELTVVRPNGRGPNRAHRSERDTTTRIEQF